MSKEKNEQNSHFVLPSIQCLFKIAWKCKPTYFIAYTGHIVVNALYPFINIIFPQYIIDELLGERRINYLILYVALAIGLRAILESLRGTINMSREKSHDTFEKYVSRMMASKCMSLDFECTEDPKVLDQAQKAREGMSWYSQGVGGIADQTANILMSTLSLIGVVIIIITGVPSLLILYAITILFDRFFTKIINGYELKLFRNLAKVNREFNYVCWELGEIKYGKDIRLYGAEKMMERKVEDFQGDMAIIWKKQYRSILPYQEGTVVLSVIRTILTFIVVGLKALSGAITIGQLQKYYDAGNQLHASLYGIVNGCQELTKRCNYVYEFVQFMDYPNANNQGTKSVDSNTMHTIEFCNVTFAYPRSERPVLKNINVTLRPGEHISVVGLNGAGKTTFIKLLCRLYDPTEGCIRLDGIDIREYSYEEYVKLIAVVFQDFQLFAFSAYENVVLKSYASECKEKQPKKHKWSRKHAVATETINELPLNEKLNDIIKEAGLKETMDNLPNKLGTNIFKSYDKGGVELSGGQQQKLAIARALYKNAPIVILDEPTAALDPIAEYEIYKKFNTLVDQKTAIYISHRLSSCQFCDIIYVFHEGTIAETGTHEQLVNQKDGLYAEMFEAQAQYYR